MVAIKSKSIDEIEFKAEQRLPVPGADVAWLVKRVRELEEALDGIAHFQDALSYRDDTLSRELAKWIRAGESLLRADQEGTV